MFKKKNQKKSSKKEEEEKDRWLTTENIEGQRPPPEQILVLLNDLLDDLDIFGENRVKIMKLSIDSKWNFLLRQNERDRFTPSPQYILKQLRENATTKVFLAIDSCLLGRISWCKQFCQLNGHLYILSHLSSIQSRIIFNVSQKDDYYSINIILTSISALCTIKSLSHYITSHQNSHHYK